METISFPYIHLRARMRCTKSGNLPFLKNSMLRGIIGRIFRGNVCHDFKLNCRDCDFQNTCIYPALFESPGLMTDKLARGGTIPHPYIIRCSSNKTYFQIEDRLDFEVILIGEKAEIFLTNLFHVFEGIETYAFGKEGVCFQTESVEQLLTSSKTKTVMNSTHLAKPELCFWNAVLPEYNQVLLRTITPIRIIQKNKQLYKFDIEPFFWQLKHRYNQLELLHGPSDPSENEKLQYPSKTEFSIFSEGIGEFQRYSLRQKQCHTLSGLIVTVEFNKSEQLQRWLPYLLFCEQFHVGKATTFGLGQYKLWFK